VDVKTSLHKSILVSLWVAVACPTIATEPTSGMSSVRQEFLAACPPIVEQVISGAHIALTLQARPVDSAGVCQCTIKKMGLSPRLRIFLELDRPAFDKRMQSQRNASFVTAGLFSAMLGCLSVDLETSLAEASIE
jgi:hypothetical protein